VNSCKRILIKIDKEIKIHAQIQFLSKAIKHKAAMTLKHLGEKLQFKMKNTIYL
jgi:hypothetical protein